MLWVDGDFELDLRTRNGETNILCVAVLRGRMAEGGTSMRPCGGLMTLPMSERTLMRANCGFGTRNNPLSDLKNNLNYIRK